MFNYRLADLENLHKDLSTNLSILFSSPDITSSDSCPHSNTIYTDNNSDWKRWSECLLNAAARHISTKCLKKRRSPPWFDSEIAHPYKRKETAKTKAKNSGQFNHRRKISENFVGL